MSVQAASTTIVTPHLKETRKFYEDHFNARPTFDCGWYVVLQLDSHATDPKSTRHYDLCLMEPQEGMQSFAGGAVMNLQVANADDTHARFIRAGISPAIPLKDNPWGDRGFGVLDPSGLMVYCYHAIAPSPEYEPFILK